MRPHEAYNDSDRRRAYSWLRDAGHLDCKTVAAALRIREDRDARRPAPPLDLRARLARAKIAVPLGGAADRFRERAQELRPRLKNWTRPEVTTDSSTSFRVRDESLGRYSSRCTYTHWQYVPVVHSAALILSPRVIRSRLAAERRTVKLPVKYLWERTSNGLAVVHWHNPTVYYYPSAADLEQPVKELIAHVNRLVNEHRARAVIQRKAETAARKTEREEKRAVNLAARKAKEEERWRARIAKGAGRQIVSTSASTAADQSTEAMPQGRRIVCVNVN